MPAESDPENVALSNSQKTSFDLPETHVSRLTQWADSWAQQFRNDSNGEPGIAETLLTETVQEKSAANTSPNSAI